MNLQTTSLLGAGGLKYFLLAHWRLSAGSIPNFVID
jgi:hypothetical protein